MDKEYHYVVKWSEKNGWEIDADTDSANFPEGTVWNPYTMNWETAYLSDGTPNGKEGDLCKELAHLLNGGH